MANKESNKKPKAPDYKPFPRDEDIYRRNREVPLEEDQESGRDREEKEGEVPDDAPLEDFPTSTQHQIDTPEDDDWNTENFDTDHTGDDLDVPGSELDDEEEDIGSEDEENNYYSMGGDNHED